MIRKDRFSEIVDILMVCLTGFALIWCGAPLSTAGFHFETALRAAIIAGLVFSFMLRSKRFAVFVGILAGLALLSLLIAIYIEPEAFERFYKGPSSYLSWISANLSGFIRQNRIWERITLAFFSSIAMFPIALASRLKRPAVPFLIYFMAGLGLLIGQRALNLSTDPISVLLLGFLLLLWFARAAWPRSGAGSSLPGRGKYMLMFIPLIALTVALGTILVTNDDKTDRPLLRRAQDFIETVRPKYRPTVTYFDYYSLGDMGFTSSEGELGGSPTFNGEVTLFIVADKPSYLAGRVSTVYGENRWYPSEREWFRYDDRAQVYDFLEGSVYTDPSHLDAMEMKFGLMALGSELDGELPQNPASLKVQNIIFGAISTKTLFLPQDTMSVIMGRGLTNHQSSRLLNIEGEQLLTGGQQDRDFIYEVQYMETSLTYSQRQQLLRLSHRGLYRETAETFDPLEAQGSGFSKEYIDFLADYSDWIYHDYTVLPEDMPQRVVDLALEITEGLENDYDRAQALRDYLVDNYEYSFEVPATPEGRDFADYFLFDLKQGYCTYFATSMAMLGRAAGLPTRYVEGFRPETRKLDDIFYFATGFNAHAWVEVYFEGYGWVAFESTPPFRYDFDFYFFSREAMAETYEDTYDDTPYFEITPDEKEEAESAETEQEIESLRFLNFFITLARVAVILAGVAAMVVLLLIIVNTIGHRRRLRFNMQTAPSIAYAVRAHRYILKIIAELGLPILPGETPIEHGRRVDSKAFMEEFGGAVELAGRIYSAAVYGGRAPTAPEAEAIKEATLALLEIARRRYGGAGLFVRQSIMGKF